MSVVSPKHAGPDSLDLLVERIDRISTLPQIALRIMEVANNPDSTAGDLKAVMEGDVALSARVLRCVNSSAYALRTKITNLQQAITYLGMKQVRNLAITASVSQIFKQGGAIGTYQPAGLWRHMVAVGLTSRLIAMRLGLANFEDMFLAGLLHDIGIVLEDQFAHPAFVAVMQSLQPGKTLCEIEREHLGFDHTMLGERLAQSWRFPEPMQAAIRQHHTSTAYHGEHVSLVRCVEVANLLCSLKSFSSVGVPLVKVSQTAMNGLSLTKQDLLVLSEDMERELRQNSSLFQL